MATQIQNHKRQPRVQLGKWGDLGEAKGPAGGGRDREDAEEEGGTQRVKNRRR